MRRAIVAGALACAVAGSAPAARQALPRATADRPDEVRIAQVHAVYAVPSDAADRELDTSGAIESRRATGSVAAVVERASVSRPFSSVIR